MPRTSALECPGCPALRVLTTDVLGLVKVIEARGKVGIPKVVETWGAPDASRCVLAASFADQETKPLVAVARKNGLIEFLNPLNGVTLATTKFGESGSPSHALDDDPIVGLHFLKTKSIELSSRISVLMCTAKGKANLRSIAMTDASPDSEDAQSSSAWDVCAAGKVTCSSVDASENYALFGGKGTEINVWDLNNCSKIWTAKPPPSNSLGIFSPTWFTAATFLSKDDHRKIAAGTNNHQVRLYDISAQRRPVISVSFRESPIKVVTEDLDGHTIYVGTGIGDLASFDMRTGKLLGCFVGKCSGSVRSIARHPKLPVLASCGLDSYLRIWDTKTRQLLSAVFLKQPLTNVVIDSHFSFEEASGNSADQPSDLKVMEQSDEDEEELLLSKSIRTSKKKELRKMKAKESKKRIQEHTQPMEESDALCPSEDEDADEVPASKRRKPLSKGQKQSKRSKPRKKA